MHLDGPHLDASCNADPADPRTLRTASSREEGLLQEGAVAVGEGLLQFDAKDVHRWVITSKQASYK